MGVAFVGRGLGFMSPTAAPTGFITPSVFVESYRLLVATGYYLVTESGDYLRTETNG
jgi:hypothetical protein